MNKIRVMLVEDHTVVRAGLRMVIDGQPDMETCADVESAAAALPVLARHAPDVLVLDLTLPGGGSLPLIESITAQAAPPRVLILTMHNAPAYVRAALAAGATGYVVKTIQEQDLLNAIRAVYRGQVVVDLDDNSRTADVFASASAPGTDVQAIAAARLSRREVEVLRLLGQGHTNQAVAENLQLSPKTVATYRARIAENLGLRTTVEFVKYAADTGLLVQEDSVADVSAALT
jgi:DNA-binding NarL/FixJ family response regulator